MTNSKTTKRALLSSVVALLVCFAMLLGTTYAWFTDSVTSAGNIIKSGTLDVQMHWAEGKTDPANATWTDASTGAIFNNDKWEPGYVEVRHIKISNVGTLALKYQLHIFANGDVSDLADVIDVYFVDPAVQVVDRTALDSIEPVGTLTEVLAGMPGNASGDLKAEEVDTITLALKMRENAGNEYQNKAIGSDFTIQLLATQLTSEKDSFDDQYDKNATYVSAGTVEELQDAIEKGEPVSLTENITMDAGNFTVAADKKAVIDLGGNDLTVTNADSTAAFLKVEGDLTITGEGNVAARQINTYEGSTLTLGEGVTISTSNSFAINNSGTTIIDGATINHTGTNHAIQNQGGTLTINDATVTSTSTSNISTINSTGGTVIINGGTFTHDGSMGSVICDQYGNSEIIINGGTFTKKGGDSLVNVGDAKLTINGGVFDSTSMFCSLDTNITINAGVFKNNATVTDYGYGSISEFIPATSTATTNADGSITVSVND